MGSLWRVVLKSDYDVAADLEAGRLETALDDFKQEDVNLYIVRAAGQYSLRYTDLKVFCP